MTLEIEQALGLQNTIPPSSIGTAGPYEILDLQASVTLVAAQMGKTYLVRNSAYNGIYAKDFAKIILPDATTLSEAANVVGFENAGSQEVRIYDAAGFLLTRLQAATPAHQAEVSAVSQRVYSNVTQQGRCRLHLMDNSTVGGDWEGTYEGTLYAPVLTSKPFYFGTANDAGSNFRPSNFAYFSGDALQNACYMIGPYTYLFFGPDLNTSSQLYAQAVRYNPSTNTWSAGTKFNIIASNPSSADVRIIPLSYGGGVSTGIVFIYESGTPQIRAIPWSINTSTLNSSGPGTAVTTTSNIPATRGVMTACRIDDTRAFLLVGNQTSTFEPTAYVCQLSGGTITWGTGLKQSVANVPPLSTGGAACHAISATKVIVVGQDRNTDTTNLTNIYTYDVNTLTLTWLTTTRELNSYGGYRQHKQHLQFLARYGSDRKKVMFVNNQSNTYGVAAVYDVAADGLSVETRFDSGWYPDNEIFTTVGTGPTVPVYSDNRLRFITHTTAGGGGLAIQDLDRMRNGGALKPEYGTWNINLTGSGYGMEFCEFCATADVTTRRVPYLLSGPEPGGIQANYNTASFAVGVFDVPKF